MSFGNDLSRFRLKVGRAHDDMIRGIELSLFSGVIMDSPVDTGRFRGNWQASIGTPKSGTLDTIDPTGQATSAAAQRFVATLKGGRLTWLANNLPYAERLEYGWSKQAPQGMVRKNVARLQRIVDEQVNRYKV